MHFSLWVANEIKHKVKNTMSFHWALNLCVLLNCDIQTDKIAYPLSRSISYYLYIGSFFSLSCSYYWTWADVLAAPWYVLPITGAWQHYWAQHVHMHMVIWQSGPALYFIASIDFSGLCSDVLIRALQTSNLAWYLLDSASVKAKDILVGRHSRAMLINIPLHCWRSTFTSFDSGFVVSVWLD